MTLIPMQNMSLGEMHEYVVCTEGKKFIENIATKLNGLRLLGRCMYR